MLIYILAFFSLFSLSCNTGQCQQITRNEVAHGVGQNNMLNLTTKIISQNSDNVVIEYKVNNSSNRTIYLFDILLSGWTNQGIPIDHAKQVYRIVDNGRLVFSRKVMPLPKNVLLEVRQYPLMIPVRPRQTHISSFEVNLPCQLYKPYEHQPENITEIKELPWSLELGYVEATPQLEQRLKPQQTTGGREGWMIQSFNESHQKLIRVSGKGRLPCLQPI
ncbi:hypothetical protein [Coleofasciculus sp. F4-SAH-05]|uniref:hypothetical protein n=1 Tax=Coleofasciculus sp. F4-SAH-05 TaxID=3069525 RepID=UPI0032FE3688